MPRLRKVLPVVVLIVAACGPASSPSPSGTPVASPSPAVASSSPAASAGDVLVLTAGSEPLPAGTYTNPEFRPTVEFAIEDGWFAGTVTDGFFDVQQEKGTPDVIAVQFAHVDGVASAAASPMSATTASAAVKAIHENPTLVVVDESASRMSGLEGLNVIVENREPAAPVMEVSAGTLSIDPGREFWISLFERRRPAGGDGRRIHRAVGADPGCRRARARVGRDRPVSSRLTGRRTDPHRPRPARARSGL